MQFSNTNGDSEAKGPFKIASWAEGDTVPNGWWFSAEALIVNTSDGALITYIIY